MVNIHGDFDAEKSKVERVKEELMRENRERRLTAQALTERSVAEVAQRLCVHHRALLRRLAALR